MLNDKRRGVYRKLLREDLSSTPSQAYIHKELAPAHIKEVLKDVGKLMDLLEDVFKAIHGEKTQCIRACPQESKRQQK